MIDTTDPRKIVSRKGNATASYFKESKRIIAVADSACFHHLESALCELVNHAGIQRRQHDAG